jgi:23S rRNA (adenine2503-C2)-methyltransferase
MIDILGLLPDEIPAQGYRAAQIFDWLHNKNVADFSEMNNLPRPLRDELAAQCYICKPEVLKQLASRDGDTRKLLLGFADGAAVEAVAMRYKHGTSLCISTQVGCKMGCFFCASGENGLTRNLSAGEMLAQVYAVPQAKSIVLMGVGEPLDNFDNVLRFIEIVTHEKGRNIGARHITLSTCGLVPQILRLAELRLQITLAVSLHAPNDAIRREIMPIARTHPLPSLLQACRKYAATTRRRITFEYACVRDMNTAPAHAEALARGLKGMLCHVNLIPVNKGRGDYAPATRQEITDFAAVLEKHNIPATVRRSLGSDVGGACGQLRSRQNKGGM